jgi:hypothetical protein
MQSPKILQFFKELTIIDDKNTIFTKIYYACIVKFELLYLYSSTENDV